MSEFFVKKFNQANKCPGCKSAKLKVGKRVYSLCATHLTKAREGWRRWAAERRGCGRCISCDRKAWNGGKRINALGRRIPGGKVWLRCKKHTLENREKCAAWTREQLKANPAFFSDKWEALKARYLNNGLCICSGHPPLPAGFKRCDKCRARKASEATT